VVITTPEYFGCAWIIDGQHRLYGFADSDLKDYETVPVVAFNEMNDITFEAKVFMDINAKQKAIDANLKWDLYEDLYVDSKDRTESDLYKISVIAKKLNKKGPLRNQIEIPKKSAGGHLTLNYVCGPILRSNLIGITGPFRKDTKADTIEYATKRINVFFKVIKENLPEQWELKKEHFINTGSGMYLFLSLLKDFIPKLIGRPVYDKLNKFEEELYEVLIDMLAYIDGLGKSDIKRFQKASTFANLAPLQEELIEKVFEQRRYDSDLLRNIRERAKEKFKVTTKNQLTKYLDEGESKTFEAKGSISMDIEEFFHSKGKAQVKNDERVNDILFAVASFLNTQGGALAIGILENNRYLKRLEETDLMDFEKANEEYSIIGIDKEAGKFSRGWDELGVYIENKILNQIEPTPHGYLDIKKKNIYRGISSVILSVEAGQTYFYVKNNLKVKSNGQKYDYPTGELFFYRTNTGKQLLQGKELEKYLKDWPR
jgi:DGQHR domain-containing protein